MELQAEEMVAVNADFPEEAPAEAPVETTETQGDASRLARIVESVLFAAGTPLTVKKIGEILGGPRRGPSNKEIAAALAQLELEYAPGQRGIQLVQVAGGYQLRTARENAEWVRSIFRERPTRLGRAQMETLAIIAYQQPVTRAEIEAVRGVDADAAVNALLGRKLIRIAGRKEALGRPLLYATTAEFLEAFGLKDISDLPSLKELGPVIDEEALKRAAAAGSEGEQALAAQDEVVELADSETAADEVREAEVRNDEDDENDENDVCEIVAAAESDGSTEADTDVDIVAAPAGEVAAQTAADDEEDDETRERAVTEDSGSSGNSIAARSGNAD